MLTIAWDVDDVLNDLMRVWLQTAWLPGHPESTVSYEELRSNPPLSELGATREEYFRSLDEFRRSRYISELTPCREALAWFEISGHRYRHLALTAVPLRAAPVSAAWTLGHFGRWIRGFHIVPSPRPGESSPEYDNSKSEILARSNDISVLVDDSPSNVEAAAALGIRAILMPRPWNGRRETVADVFRELEMLG
jgi:hypothetical protein